MARGTRRLTSFTWSRLVASFSTIRALRAAALLGGFAASRATAQGMPATSADAASVRLQDVLARAARQHPLLEAARARVAAARGARRTAGALANPILTYSLENAPFPGRPLATPLERETQTYATLPLEPLFQRWSRVRGANQLVRAADADLVRARQMVALDAARAFYRVAEAQVAVDAATDVQQGLRELQTYNEARVREGVTAEADLIRTQVELSRVEATATLARVDLARARAALAPYLGGEGADGTPIDSLRVAIDEPAANVAGPALLPALPELLVTARARRPDVVAARARVAAARADVATQQTLAVRQLGATFGSKRTAGVSSMIVGLSLPIPLFDQNRGEVQRTAALRTVAEQELEWAERQAVADVQAALASAYLLADQTERLRGTFLQRAQESQRIALAAYQDGAIGLLQVLDASRTLAEARQTYYRTIFAQLQSVLELRTAVGEDPFHADPPPTARPSSNTPAPQAPLSGDERP